MTLAPTFADELGTGTELVGQLTRAFGLGAALGYVVDVQATRRAFQQRTTQAALVLMTAGTAGLALAGHPVLAWCSSAPWASAS